MLVRVIRRRLWARLNFCIGGHFVRIEPCFLNCEKFDNSIDSPISFSHILVATAELPVRLPSPGDHFLNRKSRDEWTAHEHKMTIFLIHYFSLSQNPMVHNRKMKLIDKDPRMQSESSGRSTDIEIFIKQNCQINTHMKRKIWICLKFNARAVWKQPRAANQARISKLRVRPP